MAGVVVVLDVVHVDGFGHALVLVQVTRVRPQVGIVRNPFQVALEVTHVDRVETHQGGEQPPVGLGQSASEQVAAAGQAVLQPVQRLEQGDNRLFVSRLAGGEPGLVNAIVDVALDARIDLVDLVAQLRGIIITVPGADFIKGAVEHANDFGGLVRNDRALLLVPQNRYRDSP